MFSKLDYEAVVIKEQFENEIITTINRPTEIEALRNIARYKGNLNRNEEYIWHVELEYIEIGKTPDEAFECLVSKTGFSRVKCEVILKSISRKLLGLDTILT